MSEHFDPSAGPEKNGFEQDANMAQRLGLALAVIIPTFGFYAGTVLLKPWVVDYQVRDIDSGARGFGVGLIIAAAINFYIWYVYPKTVARDSQTEWYEPQKGHH